MSVPEQKEKGKQSEAIRARNNAVKALQKAHIDEYTKLIEEERAKLGLPPSDVAMRRMKSLSSAIDRLKKAGLDTSALEHQLQQSNW